MGVLSRFKDIIDANMDALADKMEDPPKMIASEIRKLSESIAEVKEETAGIMAEESRCKQIVDKSKAEVTKFTNRAQNAIKAGSDEDAKILLNKKIEIEQELVGQEALYLSAKQNSDKMKQMYNKLVSDLNIMKSKQNAISATVAVAKTQEKVNNMGTKSAAKSMDMLSRMEEKANNMLARSTAKAELDIEPIDEADMLEQKYNTGSSSVDDELAKMKADMGL